MADRIIQTEELTKIANAIRSNTPSNDPHYSPIQVNQFWTKIAQAIFTEKGGLVSGEATEFKIPYGVTSIRSECFKSLTKLSTIYIPPTVTEIKYHGISYNSGLKVLHIPGTVTTLENGAVYRNEELLQLILDEGITSLPYEFAYYCQKLPQITIPETCKSIGQSAFESCFSLELINIKASDMTSIGNNAFRLIESTAVINCAFSQGDVSGAPWGAPNTVTINYDVNFNS